MRALGTQPARLLLAFVVGRGSSGQHRRSQAWRVRRQFIRYLDGPQGAAHVHEIGLFSDAFVTQELRPRSVRCIREVLNRPFGWAMPAGGWLTAALQKESEAGVGVPEKDNVAGEAVSARASSCTS